MVVKFDDIRMVERVHDLHFGFGMLDELRNFQGFLFYFLYGVYFLSFFVDGPMNHSKGSLPQLLNKLKIEPMGLSLPSSLNTR